MERLVETGFTRSVSSTFSLSSLSSLEPRLKSDHALSRLPRSESPSSFLHPSILLSTKKSQIADLSFARDSYDATQLQELLDIARIKPAVNQIRYHAYNAQSHQSLLDLAKKEGIIIEAYSALTPITSAPGPSLSFSPYSTLL